MRVRLEYGRTGLDVELPDEPAVRSLSYKEHIIWGLTERILRQFFAILDAPELR